MNINNIALVRATNIIPFDGVMKPISNTPYLCKNISGEFSSVINDLITELEVRPPFDWSKIDDEEYNYSYSKILEDYLPYVSDYNSMILFSLNGICPDDDEHGFGNNIFSNKKCGIIEPLVNHIDDVISLVPTDTAVRGNVYLSQDAIILIDSQAFLNLTEQERQALEKLELTVKTFDGDLKDAIYNELKNSGRYIPEVLSLTRNNGGYIPSETSEEQKQVINDIANTYGIAQTLFFNILTRKTDDLDKLEKVKDELDNAWKVQDYYLRNFLEELLIVMSAPDELRNRLSACLHNRTYMQKIGELIKTFGIDNYRQFVKSYNENLKQKQENGTLLTPGEIVLNESKDLAGNIKK